MSYRENQDTDPFRLRLRLIALSEKWRESAAHQRMYDVDSEVGWTYAQCADELDNLIKEGRANEQKAGRTAAADNATAADNRSWEDDGVSVEGVAGPSQAGE